MANLFNAINFGSFGGIINTIIIFAVFLIFAFLLVGMVIFFIIKSKETKVFQIDMSTKRVKVFGGMNKKNKKKGVTQFWAKKIGRFLPRFQHTSIFLKGRNDAVFILTDKNGLNHTMKIPTYDELVVYYDKVLDIKIEASTGIDEIKLKNIYMLPNPHEDLDWLADKIAESDSEFKNQHWWQHPNVMIIGTAFICFLMVVVTLIFKGK